MKRTVIVNIPMTINVQKVVYGINPEGVKGSARAVSFPIVSYLEANIRAADEINFVLIAQRSSHSKSEANIELLKEEVGEVNEAIGAKISYDIIYSEFLEERSVHERLMNEIVKRIEDGASLLVDMTFGSKDVPIVEFSALNFAEKFLHCQVDRIIYGQGIFNEEQKIVDAKLCDLSPLYSLNSLTNTLGVTDSARARQMLDKITNM